MTVAAPLAPNAACITSELSITRYALLGVWMSGTATLHTPSVDDPPSGKFGAMPPSGKYGEFWPAQSGRSCVFGGQSGETCTSVIAMKRDGGVGGLMKFWTRVQ